MATDKVELTDRYLASLAPASPGERYEVADTHIGGLRVRVGDEAVTEGERKRIGKAAQVSFVLLARFPPSINPTRRTLGNYPAMALADARTKAKGWKDLIGRGVDPADLEREEREAIVRERTEAEAARLKAEEAERNRVTLRHLLDRYEAEYLSVELRTGAATRRALDGKEGLLVGLLDRDPSSITREDLAAAVKARAKVAPISTNRQLAYTSAFFNWCIEEGLGEIKANPAGTIKKPSREISRDRYHDLVELAEIWTATAGLGYPFKYLYRLLIALPNRREEIASMTTGELALGPDETPDQGIWTLPASRTKNGRALRIPLSPLARSIIRDAIADPARPAGSGNPEGLLFTTTGTTPISGYAKGKRRLDTAIATARAEAAAKAGGEAAAMAHWTIHDLRTTFTTHACDTLKVDPAVADRCLNHVATATSSKISRIYNRSEMFDQRRDALCAWARLIETAVIGVSSEVVVPLRRAER